jgi:hypothetical protein
MNMRISKRIFLFIFSFLTVAPALALEQHEKLWTAFYIQKAVAPNSPWQYLLFSQLRLYNEHYPIETVFIEGAGGYRLNQQNTIWLGYRYSEHHPQHRPFHSDIIYQQHIWNVGIGESGRRMLRSRLQEVKRSNQTQWSYLLRERLYGEFFKMYAGFINPVIHDEVFFQLNKTNYTSHQLISQNRLFLGANFYVAPEKFWEIGYMNQYQFSTPANPQNILSHILSVTYMVF